MLKAHVLNDRTCAHSGNAAHAMEVPSNARLLFCNGKVGVRLDGSVSGEALEQIMIIFDRVGTILAASNLTFEDVAS